MANVDDIYEKWKNYIPPEVPKADVEKVLSHFLKDNYYFNKGTSHCWVITHPKLVDVSACKGQDNMVIVIKGGRVVIKGYISRLMKLLKIIYG